MTRPVTIHSDGTGRGTVVLNEDGKQVADIASLSFSVEAGGFVTVSLDISAAQANVQGNVEEVVFNCPMCNAVEIHRCDITVGGSMTPPVAPVCMSPNPHEARNCMRALGHDRKHFDGEEAWA